MRTPLLLLLRWPLDGPRVVANPRVGRLRSLTPAEAAALPAEAATVLLAAPATAAVAAMPTLALATLGLAIAPTIGGCRGGGPVGR